MTSNWMEVNFGLKAVRLPVRLVGLLYALPQDGEPWTKDEYEAWMVLLKAVINRYYPAREEVIDGN